MLFFRPTVRGCQILILGVVLACHGPATAGPVDFDRQIAPLLARRCLDCHSGFDPKGKLDLSQRERANTGGESGPAIVGGQIEQSLVWLKISEKEMPPKTPLNADEMDLLRRWIAEGAKWGTNPIDPYQVTTETRAGYDWWSLQPIRRPIPPVVKRSAWPTNPIDAFLLAKLESAGIEPSAPADKRALYRRVAFDLAGLPPEPTEFDKLVNDTDPQAYAKYVDRLLASPDYGVRWARHWLDIVRFGESNGFEYNEFRPNAWRYRDWVVDALNSDMPFDQFAKLQIAGDLLQPKAKDALVATGFLVAGAYDTPGQNQQSQIMKRVVRQDELEDIVGTLGQAFLGLTVNCARCHDHKFDPIRQSEYYRLTSALDGVRHGERDLPIEPSVVAAAKKRITDLNRELEAIDAPVRSAILKERGIADRTKTATAKPVAAWDFRVGLDDRVSGVKSQVHGKLDRRPDGLHFDGTNYLLTAPLAKSLGAKTLEVFATVDAASVQVGGGALSVMNNDGNLFDAIVWAEREPGRWMAGSEGFVRTQSFQAPTMKTGVPVRMAIVYREDGGIEGYRDGQPYGTPYRSVGVQRFGAGRTRVAFGIRHLPPGGNRMFVGILHEAKLFDYALTPKEIADLAGVASMYVSAEEIQSRLTPAAREKRKSLADQLQASEVQARGFDGKAYAVSPRPPEVSHVLTRGNPQQPGPAVSAGGVASVRGVAADFGVAPDAPDAARRVALANWIAHPANPLFARVIVNRLWRHHFGKGLVDTPNDFGFNGGRPSHPELLDWLASELIAHRFQLKPIHRMMVLSSAYRQTSRTTASSAKANSIDADNRLVWRKSPQRLDAETLRDTTLFLAGRLNRQRGGPSFQDLRLVKAVGTGTYHYEPTDDDSETYRRRTLYRAWSRGGRLPLLDVFDCPDPSTTAPKRAVTITPLQALTLLNGPHTFRMADAFAKRVVREAGQQPHDQVDRAFRLAYGRPPSEQEKNEALTFVNNNGLAELARALFNSNEFLFIE